MEIHNLPEKSIFFTETVDWLKFNAIKMTAIEDWCHQTKGIKSKSFQKEPQVSGEVK